MNGKTTNSRIEKLNILGSIRAKYIITFGLLISIGFILLSLIVSSMIMNRTVNQRHQAMDEAAEIVCATVDNLRMSSGLDYDGLCDEYSEQLQNVMGSLSKMNGLCITLTDRIGNVRFFVSSDGLQPEYSAIMPNDFSALCRGVEDLSLDYSNLSGFFSERYINHSSPITDGFGNVEGVVLVSTPVANVENYMQDIIQTLVISFIWMTVAAIVIAIFISERIVAPLKELEKAAKSYSAGNFDVRVPEDGMDNEVAELAKAFNAMSVVIKEKETLQRNFLGSVSHDMRTPMTSISGFVDGILDGTIPPEKHEYYLKVVSAETHRLSRLVNSLLDITRIQSGERKFNKAEFDICELLRLVLISMEAQIDEKRIEIEFEPCCEKCIVFADSDGIHQVAYNLIHNAVKFTDMGGAIRIGVEKYEGKKYLVSVYNTGKGIKKEELPYVFDRFYKSDPSRGLDKSGAGLGLFIVKTILASHGEKIWAESEENKYCRFNFTLTAKNQIHGGKHKNGDEKSEKTSADDSENQGENV